MTRQGKRITNFGNKEEGITPTFSTILRPLQPSHILAQEKGDVLLCYGRVFEDMLAESLRIKNRIPDGG